MHLHQEKDTMPSLLISNLVTESLKIQLANRHWDFLLKWYDLDLHLVKIYAVAKTVDNDLTKVKRRVLTAWLAAEGNTTGSKPL